MLRACSDQPSGQPRRSSVSAIVEFRNLIQRIIAVDLHPKGQLEVVGAEVANSGDVAGKTLLANCRTKWLGQLRGVLRIAKIW